MTFPALLGMTRLCDPVVFKYDAPKPDDSGVSGFVIIAESHISVHTFPIRKYLNIDVFSCKNFDAQKAVSELRETFSLETVRTWTLDRGLEYADHEAAAREVEIERSQLTSRL